MPRPWKVIDSVPTPEGLLELRQRGARDFAILIGGRVLMSSMLHRSEVAVSELGCAPIANRPGSAVLVGGLGLGYTLRAVLDALPPSSRVVVAELNPVVVKWCRGPAAALTDDALSDPRVEVVVGDVMQSVDRAARGDHDARFDAIILDLYVGPDDLGRGDTHPLYGTGALARMHNALKTGGVCAVWGEEPNRPYLTRMGRAGFDARLIHTQPPGPRHAVYVGIKG